MLKSANRFSLGNLASLMRRRYLAEVLATEVDDRTKRRRTQMHDVVDKPAAG
jgi:hypothetical protein